MKVIEALNILESYDRQGLSVWSLSSLHIVFPESQATFRKTIERLCSSGILQRVSRGVYLFAYSRRSKRTLFGEVIVALRKGDYCFESLDSAASEWGIVPQTPLGATTVMTTGRSGFFVTPLGPVEFVHTDATISEIIRNTITREDFIPLATQDYTVHNLKRCKRTVALDEVEALQKQEREDYVTEQFV